MQVIRLVLLTSCMFALSGCRAVSHVTGSVEGQAGLEPAFKPQPAGRHPELVPVSPLGRFRVSFPRGEGDVPILEVTEILTGRACAKGVDDVTAGVWYEHGKEELLIYSVSPIYGIPGIWVLNPASGAIRRLVAPEHTKEGWPDGADDFEVFGLQGRRVLYRYDPDISSSPQGGGREVRAYDLGP